MILGVININKEREYGGKEYNDVRCNTNRRERESWNIYHRTIIMALDKQIFILFYLQTTYNA